MNNWFEGFAQAKAYDLLMRLPILTFNGYFLVREVRNLWGYLGEHSAWGPTLVDVLLNTASRLAIVGFIGLLFVFHLFRARPILKSQGVMPRLVAIIGVVLVLGWAWLPRPASDPAFDMAAMLVILMGNLLSVVSVIHLGRSLSVMPEARRLVMSGPYGLVRHPLYLAEGISLVGIAIAFRSWPAMVLVVANFAFQIARARYEEGVLAKAFPEYGGYKERTPMIVPSVQGLKAGFSGAFGFWRLGLGVIAVTLGCAWGLAVGVFGERYFPVVETVYPELTMRVLAKPSTSSEACRQVLEKYSAEYEKRCPTCPKGKLDCRPQLSADDEAILLGRAASKVYLRQDDSSIVIEGRNPGESVAVCRTMADALAKAKVAKVLQCRGPGTDT